MTEDEIAAEVERLSAAYEPIGAEEHAFERWRQVRDEQGEEAAAPAREVLRRLVVKNLAESQAARDAGRIR